MITLCTRTRIERARTQHLTAVSMHPSAQGSSCADCHVDSEAMVIVPSPGGGFDIVCVPCAHQRKVP